MKAVKITFSALLFLLSQFTFSQTGQWKLAGNALTGGQKLGSTNAFDLNFITDNSIRMTIKSSGKIGIGTPVPDASLHIFKGLAGTVSGFSDAPLVVENSTNSYVNLLTPSANESGVLFGNPSSNVDGGIIYNNFVNPGGLQFRTTSNFTRMVLTSAGNLGIGTAAPKANLHVFRGSAGNVSPFFDAPLVVENSSNSYLNLLSPNAKESGVLFGSPLSNVDGGIIYNSSANSRGFQFRTNGNFTRMVLTNAGSLGVRTATPAVEMHLLHADGENSTHGLRLQNSGANGVNWTLYAVNGDGSLDLFARSNLVGLFDDASGEYITLSDARRKKDIEKAQDVLEKVMQLDVKKYHFLENKSADKKHYGMFAQEVEKIFPEVVYHKKMDGSNADLYAMNYSAFGVLAIKAVQEQQKKIEEQEQTNQEQQQKITSLEDRIAKLEAALNNGSISSTGSSNNIIGKEIGGVTLEQNQPNPFNQTTVIRYHTPQNVAGQINLFDVNGALVKSLKTNESGQAVINGNDLKAGAYTYTLIVNGKMAASKKLILVK